MSSSFSLPLLAAEKPRTAGPTDTGFLLPNGWHLTPAGEHVTLTDLPLNIIPLADNRRAVVATSGFNRHELSLIDLQTRKILSSETVQESWFGLARTANEQHWYWSGGGGNRLFSYTLTDGKLTPGSLLGTPLDARKADPPPKPAPFKSGLFLDEQTHTLYSLDINAARIDAIDMETGKVARSATCGGRPYDILLARNRPRCMSPTGPVAPSSPSVPMT
ncbi:MAG: hypothetical protein U0903_14975 [Planctomycetales bacterium]